MTKYDIFLILTILTILSQIVHTWYVFDMFSKLKGWIRVTQGVIFCGILSGAIYGFAVNGDKWLALLMAVIEILINIAYYGREYWLGDVDKRKREFSSVAAYWRMNWAAYLFAVVIPLLIFIFVEKMIETKGV